MRIKYRHTKFKPESLVKIKLMQDIVEEYAQQGLRLTARQLYYQFVARGHLANTVRNYKNLTSLLADARYAGLIDWNAIEDRGREPYTISEWESISDLVDSACRSFRLPRWDGQEHYVELWVEKQALAGVLEPLAREFHVTLMVNKGYSSASAMFESARRFKNNGRVHDCVLLYLGDHDPSGEDMVRDIGTRLSEFGVDVQVEKIALTMDQVDQYNPPPNPAKTTDSRYEAYAAKHGDESWEVDALPPDVLSGLIRSRFEELVDQDKLDFILEKEETLRKRLRTVAKAIDEDVT